MLVEAGDVSARLLSGLACLSPRGTDSAGLVVVDPGTKNWVLEKVGERPAFKALERCLLARPLPSSTIGMGHVRWATRGEVSERNAHPHLSPDGRFVIVHNGNVDQASLTTLRALIGDVALRSETDSEVLIAAWAGYVQLAEARAECIDETLFARFLALVQGTNAFVCLDREHPDQMFVGITGVGELYLAFGSSQEIALASSPYVLLEMAREYISLAPGAHVFRAGATNARGERHLFDPGVTAPPTEGFAHIMQAELFHVPGAVRRVVDAYRTDSIAARIGGSFFSSKGPDEIVFFACGTSLHAAEFAAPFFARRLGIPARAIDATNAIEEPTRFYGKRVLVIALSQSGTTTDTLVALADGLKGVEGSATEIVTIGIHNNPMGALAHQVDHSLYTYTGEERATASTMAFFGQCAVLWLLLAELTPHSIEATEIALAELIALAAALERARTTGAKLVEIAQSLHQAPAFKILALGSDVAIASEGALKLEEVTYCPSGPLPAGRLKHGPLALMPDRATVLVLAPKQKNDKRYERLVGAIEDVRTRKGTVIVFTTEENDDFADRDIPVLTLPRTADTFTQGLVFAYALQALSYQLGVVLGREIDTPRNLAKTVTVQ